MIIKAPNQSSVVVVQDRENYLKHTENQIRKKRSMNEWLQSLNHFCKKSLGLTTKIVKMPAVIL